MPPFTSVTGEGLGEHSLVKPLVSLPLENIQPVNEDLSGALCVQDTELRALVGDGFWSAMTGRERGGLSLRKPTRNTTGSFTCRRSK